MIAKQIDLKNPDNRYPWEEEDGTILPFTQFSCCRGCGADLDEANRRIADGCACNSGRGVNHGLVPKNTCTCVACDPAKTGSTRFGDKRGTSGR